MYPHISNDSDDENGDLEDILDTIYEENPESRIVGCIRSGGSFGEIALRTEGQRTATIVCKRDCHFAVINKTTYANVIQKYHDKIFEEKMNFLR